MGSRDLLIRFLGDNSDLKAKTGEVKGEVSAAADKMTNFGAKAVAASAVGAVGLYKLAMSASDLQETTSKIGVVFEDQAEAVQKFASTAAKSMGMSRKEALDAAADFGVFARAAGLAGTDALKFSSELTTLAADLASFYNTSTPDAIMAIGSALRGEAEPIRAFGVLLDEATLKNAAFAMGLTKNTTDTLPPAIKVQAAYKAIMEQTTLAQGDFTRTAEGAANQQRIAVAQFKDTAAAVGTGLLPALQGGLQGINKLLGAFQELSPEMQKGVGVMAGWGTAALATVGSISMLAGQAAKLRERFTDQNGALNLAGKAAGAAGIAFAGFGVVTAAMAAKAEAARRRVDDLRASMDTLGVSSERAAEIQLKLWLDDQPKVRKAMEDSGISIEQLNAALRGNVKEYDRVIAAMREQQVDSTTWIGTTRDEAIGAGKLISKLGQLREALNSVNEAERKAAEAAALAATNRTTATEKIQAQKAADQDLVETLTSEEAISLKLAKAEEDRLEKVEAQTKAAQEAREAEEAKADAIRDAMSAARESIDPILAERRANRDLAEAAADVAKKTDEARNAKFKDAEKNADVARGQEDLIDELAKVADAYVLAQGKSADTTEGAKLYVDKLKELRGQYGVNLGPLIEVYDTLIRKMEIALGRQEEIARGPRRYNVGGGVTVERFSAGGALTRGAAFTNAGTNNLDMGLEDGDRVFDSMPSGKAGVQLGDRFMGGIRRPRRFGPASPTDERRVVIYQPVTVIVQGTVTSERALLDSFRDEMIRIGRVNGGTVGQLLGVSA